jgi:Carboxypeptidase regulatory-like domain/TonB dependent receptor
MRALLFSLVLVCTAAAQLTPVATITVVDENGVAVASARISLQSSSSGVIRCQTDFNGRCQFPGLSDGQYLVRVEKEGFYALYDLNQPITRTSNIEVSIAHQQEVREVVDVHESAPAIDPAQVSSRETLSGLDVIDMVYPGTHDFRNALTFIPGVVRDQTGQPHIAGGQTYQIETQLDGFNVTQPANGQLVVRVSTDAFRSIHVEPSREPAEVGKGPAGLLSLNTGIGDDHFRFGMTDFIPSVQNKHGWRFDQFLPRFTFSGPIEKHRIWFFNAFEGEYDNLVYNGLPAGEDNDHIVRIGNLTKLQSNITSRNILTTSFLLNYLRDQYAYLSPQSPQLSNPKDVETAYIGSIKDQHYFTGGELLETGIALAQYNLHLTPYGANPYFQNENTTGGSFYLNEETNATRLQGIANLYLPPRQWLGRHDFKVGVDLDRISYDAQFARAHYSFLSDSHVVESSSPDLCLSAPQDNTFPCTRYSTFGPAPLHEEYNSEISGYVEDRWSITNRLLVEPGIRFDWDSLIHRSDFAPRLAATFVLDNSATTKLSAGIGLLYEATPMFLIARPYAGSRQDTFFSVPDPNCPTPTACVATTGPVVTTFGANTDALTTPRFINWSVAIEKKLPFAIYAKAEYMERRGSREFVYDNPNSGNNGAFLLQNTRDDRYTGFQISLRHRFHETYSVMGSYTRSSARSNQALDFNVDNPVLSSQQPGPYPWDSPNRFLSWGYTPFFKLPILHQTELAYSVEARTGFPYSLLDPQQQLISAPGSERFPFYFSLNAQLEKRFHMLGYYLAIRGGFDNISGRCNPYVVNNVIDPINHPTPTFYACQGRAFTSRIRFLGRK